MSKPFRSIKGEFSRELAEYCSIAETNIDIPMENSFLRRQLNFWVEDATLKRVQKNLERVDELMTRLAEARYSDFDEDE